MVVVLCYSADIFFYTFPYFGGNQTFPIFDGKNIMDQYLAVGVGHVRVSPLRSWFRAVHQFYKDFAPTELYYNYVSVLQRFRSYGASVTISSGVITEISNHIRERVARL